MRYISNNLVFEDKLIEEAGKWHEKKKLLPPRSASMFVLGSSRRLKTCLASSNTMLNMIRRSNDEYNDYFGK
ncbi:MAG: hypothetical protein WCJ01_02820 [Ignavibacteria bacterium]